MEDAQANAELARQLENLSQQAKQITPPKRKPGRK